MGLRQAKIVAIIQPISSVIMLLMIAIILGFGAIRIATGAITAGALAMILCDAVIYAAYELIYTRY